MSTIPTPIDARLKKLGIKKSVFDDMLQATYNSNNTFIADNKQDVKGRVSPNFYISGKKPRPLYKTMMKLRFNQLGVVNIEPGVTRFLCKDTLANVVEFDVKDSEFLNRRHMFIEALEHFMPVAKETHATYLKKLTDEFAAKNPDFPKGFNLSIDVLEQMLDIKAEDDVYGESPVGTLESDVVDGEFQEIL